jgi:hypothetical protein
VSTLEPHLANAAEQFGGDVDRAVSWLKRELPDLRHETVYDLRHAWPQVIKRARELDKRWRERT